MCGAFGFEWWLLGVGGDADTKKKFILLFSAPLGYYLRA